VVQGYGLIGLDQIRDPSEAGVVFDIMYRNHRDKVSLDEWISYLEKAEKSLKTKFGGILKQTYTAIPPLDSTTTGALVVTMENATLLNTPSRSKASLENSSMITDIQEKVSVASQINSVVSSPSKIQANFTVGVASSRALHRFVSVFEPYTDKTLPGKKLRLQGFKIADQSGTGYCTLEDLEGFIINTLRKKHPVDEWDDLHSIYRPSYARAFTCAKAIDSTLNTDTLSISSFRLFNICLIIYAAMVDALRLVKTGVTVNAEQDDAPLDKNSFVKYFPKVKGCGFVGLDNIADEDAASAIFDLMKTTMNGVVSFSEWADYIEKAEVMMRTQLGQFFAQKSSSTANDMPIVMEVTTKKSPRSLSKTTTLLPLEIPSICIVGVAASSNLRDFVETFKAYTEKTTEGRKLRAKEFKLVNPDGSGRCSLADLETFIKRLLSQRLEPSRVYYLFDLFRPSFARAYIKAKAFNYAKDYVSITEFRVFSVYVCIYASMLDAFSRIGDNDVISNSEFETNVERFHGYEFVALKRILETKHARELFHVMDRFARGFVDFDDWCYSLEKAEIFHKTKLGEFFSLSLAP
jgi:hypothetical protein